MWRYTLRAVACIAFLGFAQLALAQQPLLPLHTGDINNDGVRSVVDANCYAQAALADAYGNDAPCQAFPDADVDLQCNGAITITDVQRSILLVLYDLTGDPQLGQLLQLQDNDLDLIHDNCDPDDDNDGFLDGCETAEGTDPFDSASTPQCDDGNACTADTCPAGIGCTHTPVAGACDDGDPCTAGDTCAGGTCVPGAPACAPGFDAICSLSGPAGAVVSCPLRVARDGQGEALPVALQVRLSWDPTLARPVDLYDLAPDGTVSAHLPGDTLDTGHTVWMMPGSLAAWNGDAALVVANTADPAAAVSAAWFDAATGAVHGAPEVLWVDFELLAPLTAPASAPVSVSRAVAATAPADDLPGRVIDGVVVVGPDCNAVVGLCDDADPCTLDLCDPTLGTCSHTAGPDGTPCDDGNACTAGDSCNAGTCTGDLAAGLSACDDSNVCTIDGCDPATGCTHAPVDCNDGNPLTVDSCDPAQGGCIHQG